MRRWHVIDRISRRIRSGHYGTRRARRGKENPIQRQTRELFNAARVPSRRPTDTRCRRRGSRGRNTKGKIHAEEQRNLDVNSLSGASVIGRAWPAFFQPISFTVNLHVFFPSSFCIFLSTFFFFWCLRLPLFSLFFHGARIHKTFPLAFTLTQKRYFLFAIPFFRSLHRQFEPFVCTGDKTVAD